jgi:hypothetical protein
MEFHFNDLSGFLAKPPSFHDLAGKTLDARKGRARLLIVVPSYKDNDRLGLLFSELKKQALKDFDIAVIYGPDDHFLPDEGLSILHINRKMDLGFSGGVYLGQQIALRDGYGCIMSTDVDKFPATKGSLSALMAAFDKSGADVVRGRFYLNENSMMDGGEIIDFEKAGYAKSKGAWPAVWSIIRVPLLRKAGLSLAPLYMGPDDAEFEYRLRRHTSRIIELPEAMFYTCFHVGRYGFKLFKEGGPDHSRLYANLFSIRFMPEIFFQKLDAAKMLWAGYPHLALLLLQSRIPEMSSYGNQLSARRLGVFRWGISNAPYSITEVKKESVAPSFILSLESASPEGRALPYFRVRHYIGLFLKSLFGSVDGFIVTSSASETVSLTLADRFFVLDEKSGKYYRFAWNSRLGMARRWMVLLACASSLAITALKASVAGFKKYPFDGYGQQ